MCVRGVGSSINHKNVYYLVKCVRYICKKINHVSVGCRFREKEYETPYKIESSEEEIKINTI